MKVVFVLKRGTGLCINPHQLKLVITGLLLMFCYCGFSQITGVHGTSERDSTISFKTIQALPRDTAAQHFHSEPDEDEDINHNFTPDPTVPVFPEPAGAAPPKQSSGTGPQVLSPAPTSNFTGTTDVGFSIPPDVQGACGPNYLMEMENERVEILSKTGTAQSTVTESAFWTAMSPSSPYDPRVKYDPYAQRWIAVVDDYGENASSCFYIAVSTTSDPTGTWQFHKIRADSTGVNWLDYPTLGFNKNWIVVTGNMFSVSGNSYSTSLLYAFDRVKLYNNTVSYTRLNIGATNTMQPAVTYDSTIATEYLMQIYNPSIAYIASYSITGALGSESFNPVAYSQGTEAWAGAASSTNSAPQLGTTNGIDLDDTRLQNVVYRNGYLWCAHNAFLPVSAPTRCSIMWWQVATNGTINQRNLIDDSVGGTSYAYPSICVNSYNDAMIGYSSFKATRYASSDYSFRSSCDANGTLESDYIYQAGANSYFQEFGGSANRWGDYTSTMVDPTDDKTFFTVQEYATSSVNIWNTWWAQLVPTHNANGGTGTWTWTGTTNTDWFNACNWDKVSLPDASGDVVIPGGTTNEPTISGAAANCKTITINTANSGILTIATSSGGLLNVAQ